MFRKRLEGAGIRNSRIRLHSTRNTAIELGIRVAGVLDVQAMARHKSLATTQKYISSQNRIRDAAEKKIAALLAEDADAEKNS